VSTRKEALKIASFIGCTGVHQDKDGDWMPCSSMDVLRRISSEAEPTKKAAFDEMEVTQRMSGRKKTKRKIRGRGYEKLRERGVAGVSTMPDGSLTSMTPGSQGALF
jgi:hypothetical protein